MAALAASPHRTMMKQGFETLPHVSLLRDASQITPTNLLSKAAFLHKLDELLRVGLVGYCNEWAFVPLVALSVRVAFKYFGSQ